MSNALVRLNIAYTGIDGAGASASMCVSMQAINKWPHRPYPREATFHHLFTHNGFDFEIIFHRIRPGAINTILGVDLQWSIAKYDDSEIYFLQEADIIIFVIDMQKIRMWNNELCFERFLDAIKSFSKDLSKIPVVFQMTKLDCAEVLPWMVVEVEAVENIKRVFKTPLCDYQTSNAKDGEIGEGVFEALKKSLDLWIASHGLVA